MKDCRCFSSVAKRGTNAIPAITAPSNLGLVIGCNISGCIGDAIYCLKSVTAIGNIISKNGGIGFNVDLTTGGVIQNVCTISGNTIDANAGDAIKLTAAIDLTKTQIFNNVISNHTTSGKYPLDLAFGSTAVNDRLRAFVDYNVYYNNLNAPLAISYGAHDTTGGANPYVDQTNNDYTLTSTYIATGYPAQANFPGY